MKTLQVSLKKIFFIIFVSTVLSLTYNLFSANGIEFIRTEKELKYLEEDRPSSAGNADNESSPLLLKSDKVIEIYKNKSAIFIDARDRWDFNAGHIPDALNIEEYNIEEYLPELDKLSKDSTYIVYCDGDDCDISKRLAFKLIDLGFTNVLVYEEGWKNWKSKGLEIEKNE